MMLNRLDFKKHRGFTLFLLIQLLAVLFLVASSIHPKQQFFMDNTVLKAVNENIPDSGVAGGFAFYYDSNVNNEVVAASDVFALHPGAYTVRVNYSSDRLDNDLKSLTGSTGYLELACEKADRYYTAFENLLLRDGLNTVEQNFRINDLFRVENLNFNICFTGMGNLEIYSVEVEEIMAYRIVKLLMVILGFALFDVIFYLVFLSDGFTRKKEVALLTLICFGAVSPFLAEFTFGVHDLNFHINRIISLANEIKAGNFYPYIYNSSLNGYGYLNPVFYCQLLLYIPALLYLCGFSVVFSYNAYIAVISVGTCLIMYFCAGKIFKKSDLALLAAAMYTLSIYRLSNIMTRGAVGEYTAQMFLPLVFLGFYNVYTAQKGERISVKKLLPIIIGLCGIMATHTLTAVMSAMVIGVFCLINFKKTFEPKRFIALSFAAVTTFLMNLYILVPFINSMSMNLKVNFVENNMQKRGTYIGALFNPMVNATAFSIDKKVDWHMNIGFAITLGLVFFGLLYINRAKYVNDTNKKAYTVAKYSFGFAAATLLLSTELIPYDSFKVLGQKIYNVLMIYQLPWRWLTFATLFGVICTVAAVECLREYKISGTLAVNIVIVAALVLNSGNYVMDCLEADKWNILPNDPNAYTMTIGDGEYLILGTDNARDDSQLHYTHLLYPENDVQISDYNYKDGVTTFTAQSVSGNGGYVDLPRMNYDSYVARDNASGERLEISYGYNNRLRVNFPAGYNGSVTVDYQPRKLWLLASLISVFTAAALAVLALWEHKKAK